MAYAFDAGDSDIAYGACNSFEVGKAVATVAACDKARVDYPFDNTDLAGSFRNRSGTLELTKIGGCARRENRKAAPGCFSVAVLRTWCLRWPAAATARRLLPSFLAC